MKKIIVFVLAFCMPLLVSAAEIVAPDMEPGHWVTTTDTSAILEQTLAAIPEANRDMVRNMMKDKIQESTTSEQCITQASLTNLDQRVKQALGDRDDCEYDVTESTSSKFAATLRCPDAVMSITTNFINSKKNESAIVSNVGGMNEASITSVSVWQSSVCPDGL